MKIQKFPNELLSSPAQQRVEYFVNHVMSHPILEQVSKELFLTLYQAGGPSLIFLLGPTGVGKTTLLKFLVQAVYKKASSRMESDKGYIPIAGISAIAAEFSQFDWTDFHFRGLRSLQEPLIENKISYKDSKRKLRFAFEDALQNRHLDAFYIDEAQHMTKVPSGSKLRDQTDCLKSISNISGVRMLLVGTYEADALLDLSDQLCRRSTTINFPRYIIENEKQIKLLKGLINSLTCHLPLAEEPDFATHFEYILERSLGCVGIMKNWFSRTLGAVLEDNDNAHTITLKNLEKQALSPQKCLTILAAIKRGEEKMTETQDEISQLRRGLGLQVEKVNGTSGSDSAKKERQERSKSIREVGKPSPRRYELGTEAFFEEPGDEETNKTEELLNK